MDEARQPSSGAGKLTERYYRYYMATVELKLSRIGNSRGVRLPAKTIARYRMGATVLMEERSDGILLRPLGPPNQKLSWAETAAAMQRSGEDWSDWDATVADGIERLEWTRTSQGSPKGRRRRSP